MVRGPWEVLASMPDVVLGYRELPSGRGWWVPEERVILLDSRLSRRGRRCVLAHELVHVRRGDEACGIGVFDQRQERDADEAAARWLVPLERLAVAELWGRSRWEVADELDVEVDVLATRVAVLLPAEREYLNGRLATQDWGAA